MLCNPLRLTIQEAEYLEGDGGTLQLMIILTRYIVRVSEVEITGGHRSISVHIAKMTAHNSSGVDIVSRHILLQ